MKSQRVPFLNYAPDAFLGKVTASLLNSIDRRFDFELRYESAFAESVRAQTLTGAGVSWLPHSLIAGDLKDGRLVPAGENLPEAALEIWIYKSAKNRLSIVESLWKNAELKSVNAGAA